LRFNAGLRAFGLATLVAIGGTTLIPGTASATDPVAPTDLVEPTPDPSASTDPAPDVTPDPTPDPVPAPTPTPVVGTPAPADTVSVATVSAVRLPSPRRRIVRIALNQRGDVYRHGATGPNAFDCSGLVRFAYRRAGVSSRLGGGHSARAMYWWGRLHHLNSRRNPRIGDVVVWGRGSHVGIYIGRGRAVSALNPRQGIRVTGLHALGASFTTFIHTRVR
jgi:cell wall-associated NlpC family hydrolase